MNDPPQKPVLVYDSQCGFCRRWVDHWRHVLGGRAEFAALQQTHGRFRNISIESFRESVHLIEPDGKVSRGAEAVFRLLALRPGGGRWLWWYRHMPGFAAVSESAYRWVAAHRFLASRLTSWLTRDSVCR